MSVVCAKVYDNRIEIAADSGVFMGEMVIPTQSGMTKLTKKECKGLELVIGGVGNFADIDMFCEYLDELDAEISLNSVSDVRHLFLNFYQYETTIMDAAGIEPSEDHQSAFLLIVNKKLYYIAELDAFEITNHYAIGAGQPYALAALAQGASPKKAVKIAANLCAFVREPVVSYEVQK